SYTIEHGIQTYMKDISSFIKYFARQTSPQEEEELMQWVDASPENRETFLKYWHMFDAIHLLHESTVVLSVAGRRTRMRTWLGHAAAMAVIFAIGYFTSFYTGRDTEPVWQEITVPSGQRIHLALADGSTVWLNSNTTLRYDPSFSGKTRRMMVDGEAYFEVSTNKKKPFVVETFLGTIEVLGTCFNVEAYSTSRRFVTSLMEGSVQLTSREQTVVLKPDQMAIVEAGERLTIKKITDFEEYSWREGLISFTDASFEEIMKKFEKHYGYEIRILNEKVKEYRCSGKFRLSDGVSYALEVLKEDVDFTYERNKQQSVITIK
ncbi:MAG: FecR domain-containing protein, partial [Bacteroides sp.]|nr:FecR domain-containing protein [Bacteroides sp.]